jgi:adenine deaminase
VKTFINGELVAETGKSKIETGKSKVINNFSCSIKKIEDFQTTVTTIGLPLPIPIIEALDGQLITNKLFYTPKTRFDDIVSDEENDILKIVVVNRYKDAPVSKAFIKNFGLRSSAIASSVAHDSHNILAVGTSDAFICNAVNLIIKNKGGVSFACDSGETILPLPVAGLMSNEDGYKVASAYTEIDNLAKHSGSTLSAPFMTLLLWLFLLFLI